MHNFSQAKLPALEQAGQHYNAAMEALPIKAFDQDSSRDDSLSISPHGTSPSSSGRSYGDVETGTLRQRPNPMSLDDIDNTSFIERTSPPMSPTSQMVMRSPLRSKSPQLLLPGTQSDSDLESHQSFNESMTPHRILERDVSTMSLRGLLPVCHSLLKPIRLGSPPMHYNMPPRPPNPGVYDHREGTQNNHQSPTRKSHLRNITEEVVAPASNRAEHCVISLPQSFLPTQSRGKLEPSVTFSDSTRTFLHDRAVSHLDQHVLGMHEQLLTHLEMLRELKQNTLQAQAERASVRATSAPTSQIVHCDKEKGERRAFSSLSGNKMPQSRSYWSFTPPEVKQTEKQKRIEAGRGRDWERVRFQPGRYVQLAERALSEL